MKRPAPIPFTKDGYRKLLEQKAKLLSERPEAVEHLRKSREMGDLSENGYYKASRARLSFLDGQLRRIERLVRFGKIVDHTGLPGTISFGNKVTIKSAKHEMTLTIVGGYESDPLHHTISHISPLGKALMGHKQGGCINP